VSIDDDPHDLGLETVFGERVAPESLAPIRWSKGRAIREKRFAGTLAANAHCGANGIPPIISSHGQCASYSSRARARGRAHAFKVMQRAFPLLDAGAPLERHELRLETAFGVPARVTPSRW
jgi:hypothetical protein